MDFETGQHDHNDAPADAQELRSQHLASGEYLGVIQHLMAGAELLPSQTPSASPGWSPEKKLAAAVLASALMEIRDHRASARHRNQIAQTLCWIRSADTEWPFSFLRLCDLFSLDPEWVRGIVRRWLRTPPAARRISVYRRAA